MTASDPVHAPELVQPLFRGIGNRAWHSCVACRHPWPCPTAQADMNGRAMASLDIGEGVTVSAVVAYDKAGRSLIQRVVIEGDDLTSTHMRRISLSRLAAAASIARRQIPEEMWSP